MKNQKIHLILDIFIIISFFVTMTWIIYVIHGWGTIEFAYSALAGIAGLSIGNLVGIYLSPFSKYEKQTFTKLQATVVSFIAGFLSSKIDTVINYLMQDSRIITNPTIGSRITIFIICLIFTSIYVYIYRKYYVEDDLGDATAAKDIKQQNNDT